MRPNLAIDTRARRRLDRAMRCLFPTEMWDKIAAIAAAELPGITPDTTCFWVDCDEQNKLSLVIEHTACPSDQTSDSLFVINVESNRLLTFTCEQRSMMRLCLKLSAEDGGID